MCSNAIAARQMSSIRQNIIAEKLNLSVATVSRSLGNHPSISEKTRSRVLQLARELGYRAAPARVALRAKRKKPITVCVLVGLQQNSSRLSTFPLILRGIQDRADFERVSIDVQYQDPGDFHPETGEEVGQRRIRESAKSGVILIYPYLPKAVEALARKSPVVSILEDYDELSIDSIDTNHHTGIVRMVDRLFALGHRRIGFVTWNYPLGGHWRIERFSAYVYGIFANGLEFNPQWVFNVHKSSPELNTGQIADAVFRRTREDGVTAWVCAADHQAYQLMIDLQLRGISVPDDCSVTGFDGIEPPPGLKPVASLRVPNEAIGAAALIRLINRLEHPSSPKRKILVETEFFEGETLAPPPRAKT
jgi:LacI family transcriptional regulator